MISFRPFKLALAAGVVFLGVVTPVRAQVGQDRFALKQGDRVVFYGDSITDQRQYTVFVENYVVTRFPQLKVDFVHSGWGGDRVTGGGGGPVDLRLQRDVLAYKPTMVTIMLGMNDASYRAFDPKIFDTYTAGYTHILDSLRQALPSTRLTLIQPSPFDDVTRPPTFEGGYNAVLVRYGDWIKAQAPKYNATVADLNTPVVAMLEKANTSDAPMAQKIIADRVHPGSAGHLTMAESLLKAWNAPALVSRAEIDATTGKVIRAENTRIVGLKTGATISWDATDQALPFAVDRNDTQVLLVLKSSNLMDTLNQQPLQVTGLKSTTRYTLTIDNTEVGVFTGEQLARSINLATLETPMMRQAMKVMALTRKHNDQHFERWRTFQVPLTARNVPAITQALPPLLAALDAEERKTVAEQRAAAQPVSHHYEIKAAVPPPTTANLALEKSYVTNDFNNYGWDNGGLIDGSLESSAQNGFASGDTASFPKSTTIDLGNATQVGTVIVGVPRFGSTKTVTVSVSADGQNVRPVGGHAFTQRHDEKPRNDFAARSARSVGSNYPTATLPKRTTK